MVIIMVIITWGTMHTGMTMTTTGMTTGRALPGASGPG